MRRLGQVHQGTKHEGGEETKTKQAAITTRDAQGHLKRYAEGERSHVDVDDCALGNNGERLIVTHAPVVLRLKRTSLCES